MANPAIFISYRRADAGGHAGRLFDRLAHWFEPDALFYDLDAIDSGEVFPDRIRGALDQARIVLVVIGPEWLDEVNRRAGQPGVDYVRAEVARALARRGEGVRVLPVLMGGAAMPVAHEFHVDLREDLSLLGDLHAHTFTDGEWEDWNAQFLRLRERIAAVEGVPAPRFHLPTGVEQPCRLIEHLLSPHFQDPENRLAALRESLRGGGSAALLARAALYGMGGIGKTQLALKYSLDYRDAYAGVWWFRAETEAGLQLDAQAACEAAGVPAVPGQTPAAVLARWLERQAASWLLVYDNAEAVESLRPYLPKTGPHHVLITSRNPAWGGVAAPLELEVWTPEQGADFLAARLGGRTGLEDLARDLGGLPLALEQAAGYLEATGLSVAEYRRLLADVDTEGLILDEGRPATGYERSVAATLSLAFEKLSPAAARLLRLCAYAAPEPLPERFFRDAAEVLPAELAAAASHPLAWNRVVAELRRYGLAERLDIPDLDRVPGQACERTEAALRLHRLTQQVVRARLVDGEEDLLEWQVVLLANCPTDPMSPAQWPRFATLVSPIRNLDAYLVWLHRRGFAFLLNQVAVYLQFGPALYGESARLFKRALRVDREDLGDDHPDTLTRMNNLAEVLRAQGQLSEARSLQEKAVQARRRVLGEDHSDTLASMNNLAGTLQALGDLSGAKTAQEKVVEAQRRLLGDNHQHTLASVNNLASMLADQGDLLGARSLQERVLEVRRRTLGEGHPDTLLSINNLALTLADQGDLPGARSLLEKVLEVRRRVLGEDHPDTLSSMNNLASTLTDLGEPSGAGALLEKAVDVCHRVLGEDHPDTLLSMNNLALLRREQGDLPRARPLQEQVLNVRCRVLGEDHPDTSLSAWNLLRTLEDMGDGEAAREILQTHLLRLTERDPGDLGAQQRQIREWVLERLRPATPTSP